MARRRRFRQRSNRLAWVIRPVAVVFGVWVAGFLLFIGMVLLEAPPNPLPPADGIVALTGGDDRVATGLALLAARDAPLLLISGAGRGTYLGDFTADDASAATRYAKAITLGHMADTTRGNALEAAGWAAAHHMTSLIIVTADYHMPRAMLEMRRTLPKVTLTPVPVDPPAMRKLVSINTLRLLAVEYSKYLAVRFGPAWLGDY
ncbi:MAG: YdcF family protein [Acidocella sp.]|nr:YdcF family protein [Acidocella sp.]